MAPSFRARQLIVVVRPWRALTKGDVVVFEHNGLEKVKRITQVKSKGLYLVGDNAHASTDSRTFGFVPSSSVQGVVVWPKQPPVA